MIPGQYRIKIYSDCRQTKPFLRGVCAHRKEGKRRKDETNKRYEVSRSVSIMRLRYTRDTQLPI
jgi:hypothetical protein